MLPRAAMEDSDPAPLRIQLSIASTGGVVHIQAHPATLVKEIQERIGCAPPQCIVLSHMMNGCHRTLCSDQTLEQCGITQDTKIIMIINLARMFA